MDDESLAEMFWGVARRLRHLTHEILEPLGITPGQSRAVSVLSKHGVMRLNELSEHLRIAPRSTTEVVDGLQERGMVERRPDPADRRAILVALTGSGEKIGELIRTARRAEAERFFAALDDTDRATLKRILKELHL